MEHPFTWNYALGIPEKWHHVATSAFVMGVILLLSWLARSALTTATDHGLAPDAKLTPRNFLEVIADAIPNEPALITNEVNFTYAQLDERVTRLANHLRSIGVRRGEHVGIHAQNCHEWVEGFYACAKISAVPVNVNYRYVEAELRYLYDNSDCVAVIAKQVSERDVLNA